MPQRGEMLVPLPECVTLARDGMRWLWAAVRCDGGQGKGFRSFRLLSLLLKGSQQEGREVGNLYHSSASSKGTGNTGRSILGRHLPGSPELC